MCLLLFWYDRMCFMVTYDFFQSYFDWRAIFGRGRRKFMTVVEWVHCSSFTPDYIVNVHSRLANRTRIKEHEFEKSVSKAMTRYFLWFFRLWTRLLARQKKSCIGMFHVWGDSLKSSTFLINISVPPDASVKFIYIWLANRLDSNVLVLMMSYCRNPDV